MVIDPFNLCKHTWSNVKTSYLDRWNWIVIERCRKCNLVEQANWCVKKENGKLQTYVDRSTVVPIMVDTKTGEITP